VQDLAALGLQSFTLQRPVAELVPGTFALKVITEHGTDRIARFAFELARRRKACGGPGRVTCAQTQHVAADRRPVRARVERIAGEFPDIELQTFIVDDFARRLVAERTASTSWCCRTCTVTSCPTPPRGWSAASVWPQSGCYGDTYAYFESAHGSAPDIAGRNVINPTATLLSGAMMLEYLGCAPAARRLEAAIAAVCAEGRHLTPDQGGSASTTDFCAAVADRL